jgi:hypothetical protein
MTRPSPALELYFGMRHLTSITSSMLRIAERVAVKEIVNHCCCVLCVTAVTSCLNAPVTRTRSVQVCQVLHVLPCFEHVISNNSHALHCAVTFPGTLDLPDDGSSRHPFLQGCLFRAQALKANRVVTVQLFGLMWRPLLHQCDNFVNLRSSLHDHMDGNRMQLPGSGWGSPCGFSACTPAAVHVLPSLDVESRTGATTLSFDAQNKDQAVH